MIVKRYRSWQLWIIGIFLLSTGLLTACSSTNGEAQPLPEIQTVLLVRAPDGPLPLNKSIEVRSRTDAEEGVSHVDLYVTLPSNEEILVRSEAATLRQKSFSTSQMFTPKQAGHYVIRVLGYNLQGAAHASNSIGFDVR